MLTSIIETARLTLIGLMLTVFFTSSSFSTDSSLYNLENGMNNLIYELSNSIVTIEANKTVSHSNMFGGGEGLIHSLISSGVIYDTSGYIITSAKAVAGGDNFIVYFDRYRVPAEIAGIDYQTGLALLKVDQKFGTSAKLTDQYLCGGQVILSLGNSHGVRASPSMGFCAGIRPEGTIQFAALVTSGTIGGGLFDLSGNLVGIIDGCLDDSQSPDVGIAIPAYIIPSIVSHLVMRGNRDAGYLGLTTTEIEISPGIEVNLPSQQMMPVSNRTGFIDYGLMVTDIDPVSPAALVGITVGDLLFQFNQSAITSAVELRNAIIKSKPGTLVELGLVRNNSVYFVKAQVGEYSRRFNKNLSLKDFRTQPNKQNYDALLKEIEVLKKTINLLEQKINHYR